jgi:hypothetical protein
MYSVARTLHGVRCSQCVYRCSVKSMLRVRARSAPSGSVSVTCQMLGSDGTARPPADPAESGAFCASDLGRSTVTPGSAPHCTAASPPPSAWFSSTSMSASASASASPHPPAPVSAPAHVPAPSLVPAPAQPSSLVLVRLCTCIYGRLCLLCLLLILLLRFHRRSRLRCRIHVLFGWADAIKVAHVRARPKPVPSAPPLVVEITPALQLDCVVAGLAPHGAAEGVDLSAPTSVCNFRRCVQRTTARVGIRASAQRHSSCASCRCQVGLLAEVCVHCLCSRIQVRQRGKNKPRANSPT